MLYLVIGLVFNIVGEEIYYRGYLLPRMRGAFGKWDWVANGVLSTLKHVYQRWLYPGILVGGLCFAFATGPLGSLPLVMIYDWVGNFLFQIVMLIGLEMAIFGLFSGLADPVDIQNTAMLFVFSAAILCVVSFIAGLGHDLRRMELAN